MRAAPDEETWMPKNWGRWLATFLSMFVLGWVGYSLPRWGAQFSLPLCSGGVALAAIYRWGWRMVVPAFGAGVAVELSSGAPLLEALLTAVGLVAGALATRWLLGQIRFDPHFGRARDMPLFIAVTAVSMTITPSIGLLGFHLAAVPLQAPALVCWARWWSDCIMGAIVVGPALIAINRAGLARPAERPLETAVWVLAVLANCGLIVLTPGPVGRSVVVMAALSLVVVGAIRFGVTLSSLGAMAILATTAVSFDFGVGLFGHFAELPGRLTLCVFDATLIASSLVVTALLAERDAAAVEKLLAERRYAQALVDGLAAEQSRIASEIHDGLGQELTGLALSLRALATRAERRGDALAEDLDDLAKLATHCIEGSRHMVRGLSPISDAGGSLESALQGLARRASMSGTRVSFRVRGNAQLVARSAASDHIYRIAQEAVQNALKHAAAASIAIELWADQTTAGLSVTDDGRGLPADSAQGGLGMRTMHFRASAIGATLSIESPRGGGTLVRCEAPLGGAVTATD
jgi:signal transduction histidine kinase